MGGKTCMRGARSPNRCPSWIPAGRKENGGEGRDSNPRVVLTTAAGKPAAALANGDLSKPYQLISVLRAYWAEKQLPSVPTRHIDASLRRRIRSP